MTFEHLAVRTALVALLALTALAAGSCAREPGRRRDTVIAGHRLGESTASPGSNAERPLARSPDTQEVSAPLTRLPPPREPAPELGSAAPPPDAGSPGVFAPPPQQQPQ